jgi:3-oxoacyl-[acyl-carrier-protein] synthase-1
MQNRKVYIQNMGAICSAGLSSDAIFDAILTGRSGVKKHKDFLTDGTLSAIGKIDATEEFDALMIGAIQQILDASSLDDFHNTFLAVGTSVGGMAWAENQFIQDKGSYQNIELNRQSLYSVSHTLNDKFGFKDSITFTTACTSSSNAVVFAKELLEAGAYDTVLVVGADSISYTTVNGFNALGVLSRECSTPFDANRTGMNVAEGVGVVLLGCEPTEICVAGVGCSSDAYNITNPHPEGSGARLAMQNALDDASIQAEHIAYINAHGTGTVANDSSEGKAIVGLFSHRPPVGSTKSITGHTLGACGTIELIISAMALQSQTIPSNFNLQNQEIKELNLPSKNIELEMEFALSNAFAFGGNNVSIVLQRVVDEN